MSIRQAVLDKTEYEPYHNRVWERNHPTSRLETLVNLVKAILGTGLLAMPEAYKHSGIIGGTVGLFLITFIATFGMHLLFDGMYFICKRDDIPQTTYPETLKEALLLGPQWLHGCAPAAPYVVNFFIIVYQMGIMAVYVVFCAENLKQVVDIHTPQTSHMAVEVYMIILIAPFTILSFVKNLKYLAPFAMMANWLTLGAILCMFYFVFETIEPIKERKLFVLPSFPLFIGTTLFSILAIGAILSIEASMGDASKWGGTCGVFNQGILIVTILNVITGFCGYWKYGEESLPSITLNLNIAHPLAQAIRIAFFVAIYISFALQSYPAIEIIWQHYCRKHMKSTNHPVLWDYVLRTILVCVSFCLALTVPFIGLFITLLGAFCLSVLGIIFPPLIDICIRWPDDLGALKIILIRDILLMLFGCCGWAIGTYYSLRAIIEQFLSS